MRREGDAVSPFSQAVSCCLLAQSSTRKQPGSALLATDSRCFTIGTQVITMVAKASALKITLDLPHGNGQYLLSGMECCSNKPFFRGKISKPILHALVLGHLNQDSPSPESSFHRQSVVSSARFVTTFPVEQDPEGASLARRTLSASTQLFNRVGK